MKLKVKQSTLGILAIFVMFMPRRLSIFGIFSFRLFIILALALAFSLFRFRIKLNGVLMVPTFWIYIGLMLAVQIFNGEYTTAIGTLLDIVVLCIVLNSVMETKKDLDFFVRLFLIMLILYSVFCVVELLTGFTPWSLLGADDRSQMRFGMYRSFGAFTTPGNNAVFLMLTFPVSWYAQKYLSDKRLSSISIVATWIALISTLSRAQIIAAIILHIVIIWCAGFVSFCKRHFIQILILIAAVTFLLLIPAVRTMFGNFFNMFRAMFDILTREEIRNSFGSNAGGVGERTMLYDWVWQELEGHRWFGVGALQSLNHVWSPNQWYTALKQSIENHYLSTLFHYGIIGLFTFILFIIQVTFFLHKRTRFERYAYSLKKLSGSIQFRILVTVFCFLGILFAISSVDDYRMFFILLVFADAYHRIIVQPRLCNTGNVAIHDYRAKRKSSYWMKGTVE